MRIILDMDDVCNKFIPTLIDEFNKIHKTNYTTDIIDRWEIPKELLDKGFWDILTNDLIENMPIKEGTKETLELWSDKENLEVVIVTGITKPEHYLSKLKWLKNKGIDKYVKDLIPTVNKEMIDGEVFIDDNPEYLRKWKRYHPDGLCLMMTASHNKNKDYSDEFIRVNNWSEISILIELVTRV